MKGGAAIGLGRSADKDQEEGPVVLYPVNLPLWQDQRRHSQVLEAHQSRRVWHIVYHARAEDERCVYVAVTGRLRVRSPHCC